MDFFGIHWAGRERLLFLPIFILCIGMIIYRTRQQKMLIRFIVHRRNIKHYLKNFSFAKQYLKATCFSLGTLTLFIAFLQPQWGKSEEVIIQESRDLLILLDISRSMLVGDLKPDRISFAKTKIRTLLEQLPIDRVGLILFSSTAFVQCPLTLDHQIIYSFLNQLTPESISMGSTALDEPIKTAISIFKRSPGRTHKLALLITDGEDFSYNLSSMQEEALKENISLFALGIGTPEGGPVPIFNERGVITGHERLPDNSIALSKLNEQKLQELCKKLHGNYVKATYDSSDIVSIRKYLEQFEKETVTEQKVSHYDEQYPWFVGLALLFLALEWIL